MAVQANLAVHGTVAYLAIPSVDSTAADVLDVSVDGQQWSARPDPCSKADGEFLAAVSAYSDVDVALMCQQNIGFGMASKRAVRSGDTARTTTSGGVLPAYGIVSQLAAAPDGTLLVASASIGSWIYRNAGGGTWTTSEDLGDGGLGWNDIAFTTSSVGWVIHGSAACCGGYGPGELWKSRDGGVSWRQAALAPQP